jgi:hypothetical protein
VPRLIGNGINLDGSKIIKLADGSAPTDGVNLGQVQALVNGLSWKMPVRAASTTNVTVTAPGASIDGVTLAVGDRVLLKNQTTGAENGIYMWNGSATALTRATDADSGAELVGAAVFVREGAVNADRQFTQNTDGTINVGTTSLAWAQFGGGITYTGDGKGVTVNGTSITLVPGVGIVNTASGLAVDTNIVTRKFASNIGDGTSTTITVTHNLGTTDFTYSLRFAATGETFDADVFATSPSTATVTTVNAIAAGAVRMVIIG